MNGKQYERKAVYKCEKVKSVENVIRSKSGLFLNCKANCQQQYL